MTKKNFNEIYFEILKDIYHKGKDISPRGQRTRELLNHQFVLEDPLDNISTLKGFETNLAYAKEELDWYYANTDSIDYSPRIRRTWEKFSDDGKTANSVYGYRIFGGHPRFINQWEWCKQKLKSDPASRQAIININDVSDKFKPTKDFVCADSLQLLIREKKLFWITKTRSQDAYLGFRNDIYCFTMMQKRMADELSLPIGSYHHFSGSIHLYEKDISRLENLLKKIGKNI